MKLTTEFGIRFIECTSMEASYATGGIALIIKNRNTSLSVEILFNCLFSTTRSSKYIGRLWINSIQINKKGTFVCLFYYHTMICS